MSLNLQNAQVVGFFSLPSPSLAEANPAAYSLAMAEAPAGAGSCAHCGTGILHHVIVRCGGEDFFIGTTCAERVGDENIRRCVRQGLTSAALAADDAQAAASRAETKRLMDERDARLQAIASQVTDIADKLADGRNGFCDSIAAGLRRGIIPDGRGFELMIDILAKQYGRRGSKAHSEAYVALRARLDPVAEQYDAIYS